MTDTYVVVRRAGGELLRLGNVERLPGGWRFIPNFGGRSRSRKLHPTMERALRPVGGLDRTETMTPPEWDKIASRSGLHAKARGEP